MTFSIVKHSKIWYAISGVLVGASILALVIFGIRPGIDFTGGVMAEYRFNQTVQQETIRQALSNAGFTDISLQLTSPQSILLRTKSLAEDQHAALKIALVKAGGEHDELRYDMIGPTIGNDLRRSATWGVILTLILIGVYILWAFRRVQEPVPAWKFSVLTLATAFHDVIIPLGVFAVLGKFYGWEVGGAFVAAMLTILGYSINDTIVVFDRTRENVLKDTGDSFETVVDYSVRQTIARSLNTTITTLLALVAIFFFGGETTRPFSLALIIGIATGAYSSVCIASPLLVSWRGKTNV